MNGIVEASMLMLLWMKVRMNKKEVGMEMSLLMLMKQFIVGDYDLQENQSSNHRRLSPPHFRYLQLHQSHSHSSVSSFMTAY